MDNQTERQAQRDAPQPVPSHEVKNHTLMGILAYLGILVIIPYFAEKHDPFVKFHVKQGLVLLCIEIVIWLIGSWFWGFWPLWQLVHLCLLILSIIGIVNVANHKQKALPVIGSLSSYFTF